jgi:hypothetical protein
LKMESYGKWGEKMEKGGRMDIWMYGNRDRCKRQ